MEPKSISEASTAELEAELRRRKEKLRLKREQRGLQIRQYMDIDVVNFLAPEHDRTSCSDEDTCNGWRTAGKDGPRCVRCALMEHPYWEDNFDLRVVIKHFEG